MDFILFHLNIIIFIIIFKANRPFRLCLPFKLWKKEVPQRWFVKQVDGPHLVFPGGKMKERFMTVITITPTALNGEMVTRWICG